jgi:hypothetical protein
VYRALDHPDIAAIGAPRPLLVLQCEQDRLFSLDSMRHACEDIRHVYQDYGQSDRFDARFYDVPHCLNIRMQEDLFDWFDRWLRDSAAREDREVEQEHSKRPKGLAGSSG